MKKTILSILIMCSTLVVAQKKEKLKGSKIVTIQKYEVEAFDQIEIEDNLEVFLTKGDVNAIEVEADDNLLTAINHQTYGKTLRLNTTKEITSFKKLEVRVTYTDALNLITNRHEGKLNISSIMDLKNVTIKTFDFSKSFINANSPLFTLITNDKSKVDLRLKSEEAFVEMSKNSELKSQISSNKLKFDMYQKSEAILEGDTNEMNLRIDNDANYDGKKIIPKNIEIVAEGNTDCSITSNGNITISASGKSKVTVYGEPKIELKKFTNDATLYKKSK
jgi:hypothetical protein